jgi:hypothetical protein
VRPPDDAPVPSFAIALPEMVLAGLAIVLLMVGTFGKETLAGAGLGAGRHRAAVTASWC